jgi:hypothetical protein
MTSKSWKLPFETKTLENPQSILSQVEMFLLAFFLDWAIMMMLYGRKGFYRVSSI